MEKNRDSRGCSTCGRILNAMRKSRVFRPAHPSTTGTTGQPPKRPRSGNSAAAAVVGSVKEKGVPVQKSGEDKSNIPQAQVQEGAGSNGSAGDNIENRFLEYIERARAKLRTFSSVGGGGTTKERKGPAGKTDESFTSFIAKAKEKMRTTSSIGGGKAVPYK